MMSGIISLHSPEGQRLRTETEAQKALYYQPILYKIFQKQFNSTFCGLVSSVLTMNANFIGKLGGPHGGPHVPFSEANMFTFKETQNILNQSEVEKDGCSLDQIGDLIKAHGYNSILHYASDSSLEEFRTKAKSALSNQDSSTSIIINYNLKAIYPDQEVEGHFSPLCAYHEGSDRFLILDTWPETEECWVTSEYLFNSLNTIDPSVSKTRGYIIVSK